MSQSPQELRRVLEVAKQLHEESQQNVDRTLIRENLKRTRDERVRRMMAFVEAADEIRGIGNRSTKAT